MDVATLKQTITTALQTSPFRVTGADLSSKPVTTLLTNFFSSKALVLSGASKKAETDATIVVEGTLAEDSSRVSGLKGLTGTATFSVDGGAAQVHLKVTGLPKEWTPAAVFASLKGGLADAFTYSDPALVLDSHAPRLPETFPQSYGYPAYSSSLESSLVHGLRIDATIHAGSEMTALQKLMGGLSSWSVSGPVALHDGKPSLCLTSGAASGIHVAGFDVSFTFSLAAALLEPASSNASSDASSEASSGEASGEAAGADADSGGDDGPAVAAVLQLEADVTRSLDGSTLTLPMRVRTFTTQPVVVQIESDLASASHVALAEVEKLLGGGDLSGQIPSDFPALDAIQLERVVLGVDPSTLKPQRVAATVGFRKQNGWTIIQDLLTFEGMAVTFTYFPSYSSFSTDVEAQAVLAGGTLDAGLHLPDLAFSCELEAGTTIDVRKLVTAAFGSSIGMPKVECTALKLFGSVQEKRYRFQAVVKDDWSFDFGQTPLALTEVGMDVTYEPGASGSTTGQVAGTFAVGDNKLRAVANYQGSGKGWSFQAGTVGTQHISLNQLLDDVGSYFGFPIPKNAPNFTLENLNLTLDTHTKDFTFYAMTEVEMAGSSFEFGVEVGVEHEDGAAENGAAENGAAENSAAEGGTTKTFKGYLWIGDFAFETDFLSSDQTSRVTLTWSVDSKVDTTLGLHTLAEALDLDVPDVPGDLDLNLTRATLTYDHEKESGERDFVLTATSKTYGRSVFIAAKLGAASAPAGDGAPASGTSGSGTAGTWEFAFLLGVGHDLDLSDLPLVGKKLAAIETVKIAKLRALVSSQVVSKKTAAHLNDLIGTLGDDELPTLPADGVRSKVGLAADLVVGDDTLPISLGIENAKDGGGESTAGSTDVGDSSGDGAGSVQSTPPEQSDGTAWFKVQRSIGPVTFDKIGVRYRKNVLWFALDASLSLGGVTLSLDGLALGSPLKHFHLETELHGLGVDYSQPPVEIGGALIYRPPHDDVAFEFDGDAIVKVPSFSLSALGSYAQMKGGEPSLFFFAELDAPLGGPSYFFITGLSGGFGYNTALTLPEPKDVADYPLVAGLGGDLTPMKALEKLTGGDDPIVTHDVGTMWLAAGIHFTTEELLFSKALAVVEFGNELVVSLLGLSTAEFPKGASKLYAKIQLALEATLKPKAGTFLFAAQLTPASFVFDPQARLTGGFAFELWFGPSDHAGNFVITLGGYNPHFQPPSWYPSEPRLGLNWSLDDTVGIDGEAYFALTPASLMAGGKLDVHYHSGNLRAWLRAHADMIVRWKPFHFRVEIGVSVGASYKLDLLFTTKTVSVELGADLTLWGPPTGGTAHVHWTIISFTIHFGAGESAGRDGGISWSEFESLLSGTDASSASPSKALTAPAADAPAISAEASSLQPLKIVAVSGRTARRSEGTDGAHSHAAKPWSVRGDAFTFRTESKIPASTVSAGSHTYSSEKKVDIRPMRKTGLTSKHTVTITDEHGTDVTGRWRSPEAAKKGVPKALWGTGDGKSLEPGDQQLVPDSLTGLTLQAPAPDLGASPGPIDIESSLSFTPLPTSGTDPLTPGASPEGPSPTTSDAAIDAIRTGIAASATTNNRDALYAALQDRHCAPPVNGSVSKVAAEAGHLFADTPMILPSS